MIFEATLLLVLSYLIGAIPSGYLLLKVFYGIDPRTQGSGNIGATNVARVTGSKILFFIIFFVDAVKAAGAVYLVQFLVQNHFLTLGAAALVLLGNMYSCFLNFGGGKGVSTILGLLCIVTSSIMIPYGFIAFCGLWISFIAIKFPVGIASVYALWAYFLVYLARAFDLFSGVMNYDLKSTFVVDYSYEALSTTFFLLCTFILVTLRHRSNIMAYYQKIKEKAPSD